MNEPAIFQTKPMQAIEKLMKFILFLSGALIVTLVTVYVITRYLFKMNFRGFEELCTLIVVWMYFIGSANASREQSHIAADMLSLFVKNPYTYQIFLIVRHAIGLVVVAFMAYLAFDFMWFNISMGAKSMTHGIPMWCYHSSLFLGMCLMLLYDALHLINDFAVLKQMKKAKKENGDKEVQA